MDLLDLGKRNRYPSGDLIIVVDHRIYILSCYLAFFVAIVDLSILDAELLIWPLFCGQLELRGRVQRPMGCVGGIGFSPDQPYFPNMMNRISHFKNSWSGNIAIHIKSNSTYSYSYNLPCADTDELDDSHDSPYCLSKSKHSHSISRNSNSIISYSLFSPPALPATPTWMSRLR